MAVKMCAKCLEKKPVSNFGVRRKPNKDGSTAYLAYCLLCRKDREIARREAKAIARGPGVRAAPVNKRYLTKGKIQYEGYSSI
jgi:hypothetical protein